MTRIHVTAAALAADLAGARVDPNEAQKALAYLRTKRDERKFFEYLRAIAYDGRAVVRSGQTLGHYRELLAASERHLRGLPADQMAEALGWAIRLLRYYRAVPDAQIARPANARPLASVAVGQAPQLAGPRLPAVGDSFLGRVVAADASAVLVEVPGFADEQAIGIIKADQLGGKRFAAGNAARVEVIGARQLRSGKTIVELRPSTKLER
ncbi:MAG: hypothetical protein IPO81_31460 [Kouleothrix sp.]|nr:hypothetical protein [Kouleothrix sp.]